MCRSLGRVVMKWEVRAILSSVICLFSFTLKKITFSFEVYLWYLKALLWNFFSFDSVTLWNIFDHKQSKLMIQNYLTKLIHQHNNLFIKLSNLRIFLPDAPLPTGGSQVAAWRIQHTIISIKLVSCLSSRSSSLGPGSSSNRSVMHSQS